MKSNYESKHEKLMIKGHVPTLMEQKMALKGKYSTRETDSGVMKAFIP